VRVLWMKLAFELALPIWPSSHPLRAWIGQNGEKEGVCPFLSCLPT
jgi:hypothetical protein